MHRKAYGAAAKGIVWDAAMPMAVPNAAQRRDLVDFLLTLKP
jgi:hypothetical protein